MAVSLPVSEQFQVVPDDTGVDPYPVNSFYPLLAGSISSESGIATGKTFTSLMFIYELIHF
jgi:hypothetical protein